jgi:hypothetical protein
VTDFVLTRVDKPDVPTVDHSVLDEQVGGQWEWTWAVALPYRALVSPSVGSAMPSAPRIGDDYIATVGYWALLQSFLTYSLR